ncbi:MAG TPA: hypothetical protein VGK17_08370 [Propionicimonas sp.]|jgi:hypothetical protein
MCSRTSAAIVGRATSANDEGASESPVDGAIAGTPAGGDPKPDRAPTAVDQDVDPLVDRTFGPCDPFVDRLVDPGVDNAPSSCDETDAAIRAASFACPCAASSNSSATRASFFDE